MILLTITSSIQRYNVKECEFELTQKGDMVARLQVKASQIGKLLQTLETKSKPDGTENDAHSSKKIGLYKQQKGETGGPPVKKSHYIDPIPPFNANKIRKSPSATLSASGTTTSNESAVADTRNASTIDATKQ